MIENIKDILGNLSNTHRVIAIAIIVTGLVGLAYFAKPSAPKPSVQQNNTQTTTDGDNQSNQTTNL